MNRGKLNVSDCHLEKPHCVFRKSIVNFTKSFKRYIWGSISRAGQSDVCSYPGASLGGARQVAVGKRLQWGESRDRFMLTISELAKRYDLAESTARYYCKRFRQFLPHVGTGKRRRYLESGVPVFEDILAAMQKNKNANAVEVYLQAKYSPSGSVSGTEGGWSSPVRPAAAPLPVSPWNNNMRCCASRPRPLVE